MTDRNKLAGDEFDTRDVLARMLADGLLYGPNRFALPQDEPRHEVRNISGPALPIDTPPLKRNFGMDPPGHGRPTAALQERIAEGISPVGNMFTPAREAYQAGQRGDLAGVLEHGGPLALGAFLPIPGAKGRAPNAKAFVSEIQGRDIPAGKDLTLRYNPEKLWHDILREGEPVGRTFVTPTDRSGYVGKGPLDHFILGPKVEEPFQRQGIGESVYNTLEGIGKEHGMGLIPGLSVSKPAFDLWRKRDPATLVEAMSREGANGSLSPSQREWLAAQNSTTVPGTLVNALSEQGKPIRGYHGTDVPNLTVFDPQQLGKRNAAGVVAEGHHFSTDKANASQYGPHVGEYDIHLEKPFTITDQSGWQELTKRLAPDLHFDRSGALAMRDPSGAPHRTPENVKKWTEILKREGYDGVVANNPGREEIVAFNPSAINAILRKYGIAGPAIMGPALVNALSGESDNQ